MMKKLKFKEPYNHHFEYKSDDYNHHFEYKSDIDRIVKIFADRGYEISHTDAVHAWEQFSDSMCAGWMCLGDDDEVFSDVFSYFEEVE